MKFTSFHIENFRCFSNFTIDGLERINLIAGMNNAGKTSLLEAIYLFTSAYDPELFLNIIKWRSFNKNHSDITDINSLWGFLYLFKDINSKLTIDCKTDCYEEQKVEIEVNSAISRRRSSFPLKIADDFYDLFYSYFVGDDFKGSGGMHVSNGSLFFEYPANSPYLKSRFLSTNSLSFDEDNNLFSDLAGVNGEGIVVDNLKYFESRLQKMSILVRNKSVTINCDIGESRLIPIQMMGEGIRRSLSILLFIYTNPNSVLLIDEIENGIHYSVMGKIWKVIGDAARENDVQIFATTHSWECIQTAHKTFSSESTYDFRFHRLDRVEDDIEAVTYSKEALDAVYQTDLEVR